MMKSPDEALRGAMEDTDVNKLEELLTSQMSFAGAVLNRALVQISRRGQPQIAQLLIVKGANVNARDTYGNTSLMLAGLKGDIDMVHVLMENGADISLRNQKYETAEMLAERAKRAEVIQLLQEGAAHECARCAAVAARAAEHEQTVYNQESLLARSGPTVVRRRPQP